MDWLSDDAIDRLRESIETPDLTGTRYELVRELGRGGMGAVHLARDAVLDRPVAIKVLHFLDSSGQAAARMRDEARILARLEHPGIVPIHDAGTLPDGRPYYVMKLVQGQRLDQLRDRAQPLPELLRTFARIAEPVAFAHSQGVIHRDLKPENIMLGPFGEVLVLDWGVAQAWGGRDPAGTVVGTARYMAPEQSRGAVDLIDGRSDVYSLGRILSFFLAAGEEQFSGASRAVGTPREPGRIPPALRSIVAKATAEDPAARYPGVLDLAADIGRYLDGLSVSAHRETLVERAGRLLSRNRTLVGLILAYLLMRLVLFFFIRR
ncbi:MAG TPA: serine/threonine-protein kinase [Terriglobales bacterium]